MTQPVEAIVEPLAILDNAADELAEIMAQSDAQYDAGDEEQRVVQVEVELVRAELEKMGMHREANQAEIGDLDMVRAGIVAFEETICKRLQLMQADTDALFTGMMADIVAHHEEGVVLTQEQAGNAEGAERFVLNNDDIAAIRARNNADLEAFLAAHHDERAEQSVLPEQGGADNAAVPAGSEAALHAMMEAGRATDCAMVDAGRAKVFADRAAERVKVQADRDAGLAKVLADRAADRAKVQADRSADRAKMLAYLAANRAKREADGAAGLAKVQAVLAAFHAKMGAGRAAACAEKAAVVTFGETRVSAIGNKRS
eukprot:gene4573-14753_t